MPPDCPHTQRASLHIQQGPPRRPCKYEVKSYSPVLSVLPLYSFLPTYLPTTPALVDVLCYSYIYIYIFFLCILVFFGVFVLLVFLFYFILFFFDILVSLVIAVVISIPMFSFLYIYRERILDEMTITFPLFAFKRGNETNKCITNKLQFHTILSSSSFSTFSSFSLPPLSPHPPRCPSPSRRARQKAPSTSWRCTARGSWHSTSLLTTGTCSVPSTR